VCQPSLQHVGCRRVLSLRRRASWARPRVNGQVAVTVEGRHRWAPGDGVVWDNRCVLHRADRDGVIGDRVMHRVRSRRCCRSRAGGSRSVLGVEAGEVCARNIQAELRSEFSPDAVGGVARGQATGEKAAIASASSAGASRGIR